MNINGTEVTLLNAPSDVCDKEIVAYINNIRGQYPGEDVETLTLEYLPDGNVAQDYTLRPPQFQRIRRITGYLVGTLDRFNNAKRAEEHDRVKHSA